MDAPPQRSDLPPVILSALSPDQHWESGLGELAAFRGLQCLLGWDSQLQAIAAMLARIGARCLVTPAPEMFFTPTVAALLAPRLGIAPGDLADAVHVRVGSARFGRILRGMPNLIANAETQWHEILAPGEHPFRAHNVAAHAFAATLDLVPNAASLFRPDGTALPRVVMPATVACAGLPEWNEPQSSHDIVEPGDFRGFEIHAIGEFNAEDWGAGKIARPSQSLRRIAVEWNANAQKSPGVASPRPLLLLPWNLSNPAHGAPDLAVKYLRAVAGTEAAGTAVLLPFNPAGSIASALNPLIEGIRQRVNAMASHAEFAAIDPAQANLFVARVTDLAGLGVLRKMRAVAWIDGLDPEAAWTRARLAAAGLPSLTLLPPGTPAREGDAPVQDEAVTIEVRNEFGRLFYRGGVVSLRGMERLIALTQVAARQPRPLWASADSAEELKFAAFLGARAPRD